jgi:hypothetical protein
MMINPRHTTVAIGAVISLFFFMVASLTGKVSYDFRAARVDQKRFDGNRPQSIVNPPGIEPNSGRGNCREGEPDVASPIPEVTRVIPNAISTALRLQPTERTALFRRKQNQRLARQGAADVKCEEKLEMSRKRASLDLPKRVQAIANRSEIQMPVLDGRCLAALAYIL